MISRHLGTRSVVATSLLLLLSIATYFHFGSDGFNWATRTMRPIPEMEQIPIGDIPVPPTPTHTATTPPQLPHPTDNPQSPAQEPHTFKSADDFWPHFRAVTRAKAVSMAQAKSTCTWAESENVNFQYGIQTEWAQTDRSDEELAGRRNAWQRFITNELLQYPKYADRFEGRGIVIVAGNEKSVKRVQVMLRQLKKVGSQLPIEIHYWGDELSAASQKILLEMWPKMYFNDLSAASNILKSNMSSPFHINYQFKTVALINSKFAEPLLLDSDNIPVVDPESLYETGVYKEFGTLFWPDIARTRPQNPMWAITNTPCRMNEYEQESGQLMVDKRRYFYHLQLAAWFNNEHGSYYNGFLLGDKDMFRFAWHALKTKYGYPAKWLVSIGTLSPTGSYYCGHSFGQHHPNGSVAFIHGGLLKTIPKPLMRWHRQSRGGIFQSYKMSIVDERHNLIERVEIKMDGADYMPDRPEGMAAEFCTDMRDVAPRWLHEIVPGFQRTFEEIGGYWILDEEEEKGV